MIQRSILAVLLSTLISACALVPAAEEAVADLEQGSSETEVYRLTEEQAVQVIADAIAEGWPDSELERLEDDHPAYRFTLWFVIDRERIVAEALPRGDGYAFRVVNRGTAPVVGVPARDKLIPLIEKYAQAATARP